MYQTVGDHLKTIDTVLIASHVHPDGDAIGALTALGAGLLNMGKNVTLYNEDPVPAAYRFLPLSDCVVRHIDDLGRYEAAVILDCSKIERIGRLAETIGAVPLLINIDHHCSNDRFGGIQLVDCEACATAEIVYNLLKTMEVEITREVAYGLYTGIVTDTASFSMGNTGASTFAICGELVRAGADPQAVSKNVYITYSAERIRLMQMVLNTFELSENGAVSMLLVTQEMIKKSGMKTENVGRVVNYAKHIENVRIAALVLEEENHADDLPDGGSRFHVSLRSDGSVDAARIAVGFGGGGHSKAAGFNITATLSGVKETILRLADSL
ncbi:MAG: bifunctional oligoribonuclease/PAP phosphatase NrnA [Thermodesulfobacteriota bacterium]|nr:bifunctional oligoribonuclease/PAP phosphatase NrnA [Thermodesulfobacteriota bacterium]